VVSAAIETNNDASTPDPRSTALSNLLKQGSAGSVLADSTPLAGTPLKGDAEKSSGPDLLAEGTLLVQGPAESAIADSTPLAEMPLNDGKRKKDGSDAPVLDAQNLTASGDNPQIELPGKAEISLASQARPARSAAIRADAALPAGLPASTLATRDEFRVEWTEGRNAGVPAELAFALRLKPIVPAPVAQSPSPSSPLDSREPGAKTSEKSDGAIAALGAAKPANNQASNPQSGNEDASRRNHAASHEAAIPDQPAKPARTEDPVRQAPVENKDVHAQGGESRVAPPIPSTASPAVSESPAPPKALEQPAPAPAAISLDTEDRLTTTRPMKEISLQISSDGEQKVDVRLVERGGEVLVSVRTPDTALGHEMRQELGSLTGKLAQSGYATEQFTPAAASSSNLSNQRDTSQNQDSSRGQGQDPQNGGSGQQQQPQDERGKRPAWLDEVKDSLAQRQTNRSTAWLLNR
jgi:hypothetical protein